MPPTVSPDTCARFIDDLIAEAQTNTGTWRLSTYVRMRDVIRKFPPAMAEVCVKRIFAHLLDAATTSTTRYKLSQICSAIHMLGLPDFDRLFREKEVQIQQLCDLMKPSDLGAPTISFLHSLTAERRPHPSFGGASETSARRSSVRPIAVPARTRSEVQASSKTPDPHRE
jgi:hypothetical protein